MSEKSQEGVDIPVLFLNNLEGIDFEVFVQVGDRDVLYCRPDDSKLSERVNKLHAKKGLQFFRVKPNEYGKFLAYIQRDLDRVFQNPGNWSPFDHVQSVFEQQYFLIDQLLHEPASRELYHLLRSTTGPFFDFFSRSAQRIEYLYKLNLRQSNHGKMITHMIRVAALTARLLIETNNDSAGKPVYEIIMGTFLHDMAFFQESWPMDAVPKSSEPFRSHPSRAEHLGLNAGHYEPWVLSVMAKHEEHIDGSGFPLGLREDNLDPTIICVAICNAFDRLITIKGMNGADGLKQLLIEKMGAYPLPMLQILQNIVKEAKVV